MLFINTRVCVGASSCTARFKSNTTIRKTKRRICRTQLLQTILNAEWLRNFNGFVSLSSLATSTAATFFSIDCSSCLSFFSCYHACPNNFHLGNMIKVLTVCVFLVHLLEIQSRASPIWHTLMVFIDFGMITRGFVQVSPSIEIFQNHLENFLCTSHIEGMY